MTIDLQDARMWAWDHLKAPPAMSLNEHLAQVERVAQFIVSGLVAVAAEAVSMPSWRDISIGSLELSVRAWNCLKNENYLTAGAVDDATDADLLRLPNLGRRTLNEVRVVIDGVKRRAMVE